MPDNGALLELMKVSKAYGSPGSKTVLPVLDGIDLVIERGESLAIVGPSGSGKSTLLNIMGGLDEPTSGEVRMAGRNLCTLKSDELARIRNQEMGFVFQLHHLLDQLTVLENVLVPTLVYRDGKGRADREARAHALLERVGLKERTCHRPGQLSGGERQRVALVRALINRPGLLLADEPTGSLDRSATLEMARLLKELNSQEGVALVVVTHALEVARCMDRVQRLQDGRLTGWKEDG
jgi:ABC-type lipoprotein export system ATPase subunit